MIHALELVAMFGLGVIALPLTVMALIAVDDWREDRQAAHASNSTGGPADA